MTRRTWTGLASNDWNDGQNWHPKGVPGRTRWQRFRAWLGRRFRRAPPIPCPTSPYPMAVRDMHRYPVGVADLYYTNHPYRARLDNWLDLHREPARRLAYATAAALGLALAVWLEGQGVVG